MNSVFLLIILMCFIQKKHNNTIKIRHCVLVTGSEYKTGWMGHSSEAVYLVIKASPVPAGTVEACCYEQDDQQGDEQATPDDGGSNGPDQRSLGHVDQGGLEGHAHPACSPSVLRRVPGQVDPLHTQ